MNRLPLAWIDRCGAAAACAGLAVVAAWWLSAPPQDRFAAPAPADVRGGRHVPAEWAEAERAPEAVAADEGETEPAEPSEPLAPETSAPTLEPAGAADQPSLEAVIGSVASPVAAFRLPGHQQAVLVRPGQGIPGTSLNLREIVHRRVAVRHRDGWPVDEVQTRARLVGPEGESELPLGRSRVRIPAETENQP